MIVWDVGKFVEILNFCLSFLVVYDLCLFFSFCEILVNCSCLNFLRSSNFVWFCMVIVNLKKKIFVFLV